VLSARVVQPNSADRQYASASLIPVIDELMVEAKKNKADIEAIVVGIGPGSFTGVRTAVVSARAMAQALSLPLIGISILECYVLGRGIKTGVALSAGRGNYYAAIYELAASETTFQPKSQLNSSNSPDCHLNASLAPVYIDHVGLIDMLNEAGVWLADAESSLVLKECPGVAAIEPLPILNNIAERQVKLALNRLSLAMSAIETQTRQSLLASFPYENIEPLYLRGASITLKADK
jgi:tRNA threonylcarbamoyl adenosine modification protein YeaZ